MKYKLKRILSLLLCFVMVLGLFPTATFATESGETTDTGTETGVTTGNGTETDPYCVSTYSEMKRLLRSPDDNIYIKVVDMDGYPRYLKYGTDYGVKSGTVGADTTAIFVYCKKHLEIPKGIHLSFIADPNASFDARLNNFIIVHEDAELDITGEGSIHVEFEHQGNNTMIKNFGKLTIDGNVLLDAQQKYHRNTWGHPITVDGGQTVINGGRFYAFDDIGPVSNSGTTSAVWVDSGTLEINGGDFRTFGDTSSTSTYIRKNWPLYVNAGVAENVTLKGGDFDQGMNVASGIDSILANGYQILSLNTDRANRDYRLLSDTELAKLKEIENRVIVVSKVGLTNPTLTANGTPINAVSGITATGTIAAGDSGKTFTVSVDSPDWLTSIVDEGHLEYRTNFLVMRNGTLLSSETGYTIGEAVIETDPDDGTSKVKYDVTLTDAPAAGEVYTVAAVIQPVAWYSDSTAIGDSAIGTWALTTEEKKTSINSVTLNMSDKLKEGNISATAPQITATGDGFSSSTSWYITDPTKAGRIYRATVTLTAKEGYVFTSNTTLAVNGAVYDYNSSISDDGKTMTVLVWASAKHDHMLSYVTDSDYHWQKCSSCSYTTEAEKEAHVWGTGVPGDSNTMKYTCTVCHKEITVDTVNKITNLSGYPEWPQVGDSVKDYGPASVTIGQNSYGLATVTAVEWYEGESATGTPLTFSDTFKADTNYTAKVTFTAADGCAFDSSEGENDTLLPTNSIYGVTPTAYYYKYNNDAAYSAEDEVDNKVVTGSVTVYAANITTPWDVTITLPTLNAYIGQSAPAAQISELPNGVELTGSWGYSLTNLVGTDNIKPDTDYLYMGLFTGDNAKKYAYNVTIVAGDSLNQYVDSGIVLAAYKTADTSKITSVALTVDAPEYGKAPATTATGADNTRYTVGTPTWSPEVTDGKFGASAYTVSIPVTAQSGYSFDENCTYTVNGYAATYADGKVSYAFQALTAPHEHDFNGQPWICQDSNRHYQMCKNNDGLNIQPHNFSTWTDDSNDTTHSRTCDDCTKSGETEKYKETADHNWMVVVDKAATVTESGIQHEECTVCHAKRNENTVIPAHGHNLVHKDAKEATCTETGYKGHYQCTDCGLIFEDYTGAVKLEVSEIVIPATGHVWNSTYSYDADGHWTSCTVCGEVSEKTAHTFNGATCLICGYQKDTSSSSDSSHDSDSDGDSDSGNNDSDSGSSYSSSTRTRKAATGIWIQDEKGWWYKFSNGTYPKNGWAKLPWQGIEYWYYFDADGYMKMGWLESSGSYYYLNPIIGTNSGKMLTGWQLIDQKWYYFSTEQGAKEGSLLRNTVTPDNYQVDQDGVWKQ